MEKNIVTIGYGLMYPSINEQLNAQGFMLNGGSENFEKYREAYNTLRLANLISDSEDTKIATRLNKRVVKQIRKFQ